MDYDNRLLRFLKVNSQLSLTSKEIATLWKRSVWDVAGAAVNLLATCQIKMDHRGVLSLP